MAKNDKERKRPFEKDFNGGLFALLCYFVFLLVAAAVFVADL